MQIMTKNGWRPLADFSKRKPTYVTVHGKQYFSDYRRGFKTHIIKEESGKIRIIETAEDYIQYCDEQIFWSKVQRGVLPHPSVNEE